MMRSALVLFSVLISPYLKAIELDRREREVRVGPVCSATGVAPCAAKVFEHAQDFLSYFNALNNGNSYGCSPDVSKSLNCNYYDACLSSLEASLRGGTSSRSEPVSRLCFEGAMSEFVNLDAGCFTDCSDLTAYASQKSKPPCLTEDYVNVVTNSFNGLASCLGVQASTMFAIFASESGFMINAMRCTPGPREKTQRFDSGISQLTTPMIQDVNDDFDKYFDKLAGSTNPMCKDIAKHVKKINETNACRCHSVTPPDNPITNMFYGMVGKAKKAAYVREYAQYRLAFLLEFFGFNKSETYKTLAISSYNKGSSIPVVALETYLEHKYQEYLKDKNLKEPISKAQTAAQDIVYRANLKADFSRYDGEWFRFYSENEGGYFARVIDAKMKVERKRGVKKCGSASLLSFF